MKRRLSCLIALLFMILNVVMAEAAFAQSVAAVSGLSSSTPAQVRAEAEIGRLAGLAGGRVGVGALHVETGRSLFVNGQERFPMASTYKIPIALQLLTLVDQGTVKLEALVEIKPAELRPGSGILTKYLNKPGLTLSVANLFDIMMGLSDNTAADILLEMAGGPEAVNDRMKAIGISGVTISRSTLNMIADSSGIQKRPPDMTPEQFNRLARDVDPAVRKKMRKRFNADIRDTATPEAMAALLRGVYLKTWLKPETSELLLDAMLRSQTGEMRLKGMLPPGTPVAHKSGTLAENTNDTGIITLPAGAGHIAIAVFIKSTQRESTERERAIAEIARAVHDYYLFGGP